MLNQKKPDDYVISTGKHFSVRDFTKLAFELVDLDYKKFVKIEKVFIDPPKLKVCLEIVEKLKKVLFGSINMILKNL